MSATNNTANHSFVYDEREVNLLETLPEIYQAIYDYRGMCNASAIELSKLYGNVITILDDQFITTCSSSVLAKWERYLGITPKGTDTLDERRFRILSKLNDTPPYTDRYLEKRLNELCGKDRWKVTKDYSNYKLVVEISLDSESNTETVSNLVRSIIPANIELVVDNYRVRHSDISALTHARLAKYTYDEIKYHEALL